MGIPNRVERVIPDEVNFAIESTNALGVSFIIKIIKSSSTDFCLEIKHSEINISRFLDFELQYTLANFLLVILTSSYGENGGIPEILLEIKVMIGVNRYMVNIKNLESAHQPIQLDIQI